MSILIDIAKISLKIVYFVIKIFPTRNKILFLSRQSNEPSIDFVLLNKELKSQNKKINTVMLTKRLEKGIVNKFGYSLHMWRQMYHLATSKVVIIDGYQIVVSLLNHKKSVKVIQIWHALGCLKKFGYSIKDKQEGAKSIVIKKMSMHKNYDMVIASSSIARDNFANAFNVSTDIIKVMGLPRIDFLLSDQASKEIRNKMFTKYKKLNNGKPIILYVPTFRKNEQVCINEIINEVDLGKYNLIIKLHNGTEQIYIDNKNNFKMGNIASGMEMLHIADYVITDYSAICFEAAIMKKPLFFYVYDLNKYKKNREMYIDFENEMPGVISQNAKDIINAIKNNDYDKTKIEQFAKKYVETINHNNSKELALTIMDLVSFDRSVKKTLKNIFKKGSKLINIIFTIILNRLFILLFKLNNNKVLFLSDVRENLGGNLEYIYDNIDKKYEKVKSLKPNRMVKREFKEKIKTLYDLSTSKYIILDDFSFNISAIKVRKGQEVCQLWHGPGALKKFGFSRVDRKHANRFNSHRNYTKAIVTSENIKWCFAEGFGMDEKDIAATGFPRMDCFFDDNYKKEIKEDIYLTYPELKDKKIILFAPTYRGNSLKKAYYDFDKLELDKIYKELKEDYIFIFKWHPGVYDNIQREKLESLNIDKYNGFYVDLSNKRDINDLLFITDILITDYSSVIFDYIFINKPIIYFTYDLEEYKKDRGLYFPFEDYVYGDITYNTNQLIESIKQANMMESKRKEFKERFVKACDGKSIEKTCKWIFGERYKDD